MRELTLDESNMIVGGNPPLIAVVFCGALILGMTGFLVGASTGEIDFALSLGATGAVTGAAVTLMLGATL